MKLSPVQQSFNAGEFSPRLMARTDFPKYGFAGEVVENFLMLQQGGMMRRPGTRFVAEVKSGASAVRLLPFVFGDDQAYIIEAGDVGGSDGGYFRFYMNKGQIQKDAAPYEIQTPYAADDLRGIRFAQSADVMYLAHPTPGPRQLSRSGHTSWSIGKPAFTHGPYIENATDTTLVASDIEGSVAITASSTVGINDGAGFKSTDVGRMIRLYEGWCVITSVVSTTKVTADVKKVDGFSLLLPKYTTNTIRFKEGDPSNTGDLHNDSVLDSAGKFVEYNFKVDQRFTVSGSASNNGDFRIVYVDSGQMKLAIAFDVTDESAGATVTLKGKPEATTDWGLGCWSDSTGWPVAVGFHEERLYWAGTSYQPQTFWGSTVGDFLDHAPGSNDDNALNYQITSGDINVIRWLASSEILMVGTAGAEFKVTSDGPVLTPTDVQVRRVSTHGSSELPPVQVGNVVLFAQRNNRKLWEFAYSNDQGSYVSQDLTTLSQHITGGGLTATAWQEQPDSLFWGARSDGQVCVLTYKRDQDVVGWSRQILGGAFGSGAAVVESVAVIPSSTSDVDEVWMVVKRTIDGETRRYVEVLEEPFSGPRRDDFSGIDAWKAAVREGQKEAFHVDSGLTYSGDPATEISGLDHLEGETVAILADGWVHPERVVSGGKITLDSAASVVTVGLPYVSRFKSTKPVISGPDGGTSIGKPKRVSSVGVYALDASECLIGLSWDDMAAIEYREVEDPMDAAVPLFTGEVTQSVASASGTDPRLHLKVSQPLPFTLLALAPIVTVSSL